MEELYQILALLKNNRTAEWLSVGRGMEEEHTLLQRFFNLLCEGRSYDDDEMATALYGKGCSSTHPAYQKLKHKLKYRLLNFVLLMDKLQPDYTSPENAVKTIHRELATAKIIAFSNSARRLAISLLRKVYKRAEEFEVTDVCTEAARYLANLYGLERKAREREAYREKYKHYRQIELDKQYVNETYADMLAMYRLRPDEEIISFLAERLEKVNNIVDRSEVVSVVYGGRLILQAYHQLRGETRELLRNDEVAIRQLMGRPGTTAAHVTAFKMSRAQAFAGQKNYARAFAELDSILEALDEHSRNYFKVVEIGMTLSLECLDAQKALDYYGRINKRKLSGKISQGAYEHLIVLEAYLQFALESGRWPKLVHTVSPFRLSRFRNEIGKISSQKDGFNLHLYIIEWIFLLRRKRYNLLFDREEAFAKYLSRYVNRKERPRLWAFCRLLLQIPKSNFHAVKVCNDGKRFLRAFRLATEEGRTQGPRLEILPFSFIWEVLLSDLKGYEYLEE